VEKKMLLLQQGMDCHRLWAVILCSVKCWYNEIMCQWNFIHYNEF
jgi:hypothetical protein